MNYLEEIIKLNIAKAEKDLSFWKDALVAATDPAFQTEREVKHKEFKPATPVSDISDPMAKSPNDLVTPKQLGMIRALAREAGVDVEEECQEVLRCKSQDLSKKAASSFIDHLKNIQNQERQTA